MMIDGMKNIINDGWYYISLLLSKEVGNFIKCFDHFTDCLHLFIRKFRMATYFINGVDFRHIVNYAVDKNNSYECTDKNKSVHQVTLPSSL